MSKPTYYVCDKGHECTVQSWGTKPSRCLVAFCRAPLKETTADGRMKHERVGK